MREQCHAWSYRPSEVLAAFSRASAEAETLSALPLGGHSHAGHFGPRCVTVGLLLLGRLVSGGAGHAMGLFHDRKPDESFPTLNHETWWFYPRSPKRVPTVISHFAFPDLDGKR